MLQGLAQVGKRGRLIVQKRLCTGQKHKIVGWLAIGNRGFYQSQQAVAQSAGLLLPAGRFKACGVAQAQPGIGYATVSGSTSWVRRNPSGVNSKAQAKTRAKGKPTMPR